VTPRTQAHLTIEELGELGERHTLTPVKVHRLRLRIELEPHLTKSLSTPTVADKLRELVQSDTKSDLMDFRPEQVNGHWQIQYPLAVFASEVEKTR
jgi:hypothetical protein